MRKLALIFATAAAVLSAGALSSSRAEAMTLGGPTGVRLAAEAINPVDNVRCWWNGWRWVCSYGYGYYGYGGWPGYGYGYRGYGWRGYGWRGYHRRW